MKNVNLEFSNTRPEFTDEMLCDIRQKPMGCTVAICDQVGWLFDGRKPDYEKTAVELGLSSGDTGLGVDPEHEWRWYLSHGYKIKVTSDFDDSRLFEEGLDYSTKWMSVAHSNGSTASRTSRASSVPWSST